MEQSVILAKPEQTKELSKPTLVKDVTLISSGIWTGMDNKPTNFSAEAILSGFQNTNWDNMNLFLDHQDQRSRGVSNWAGFVKNARMVGNDLVGDLEVWHPMISMFIKEAKAKFGVSMTTEGIERMMSNDLFDYDIHRFVSFSIVDDPACKVSLIDKVLASGKETKTFISSSIEANKELQVGKFNCECIKCGNKMISEKHCSEITCLKCGGQMRREERPGPGKELANPTQKKIISNEQSEDQYNQKEVKKMESEQKETVEDKKEPEEAVEDKKEFAEAKESEGVKVLSSKVDGLSNDMKELKAMMKEISSKKELAESVEPVAVEPVVEEPVVEAKAEPEESEAEKELKAKNAELQKELSALKEDNSPDKKSLAVGGNEAQEIDVNSANFGMLGFLKENANLNY